MNTQTPTLFFAIALLAAAAVPKAADATILSFIGTRENVNPITGLGVGRCGLGRRTVTIAPGAISASGTSNFGDFAPTQSHCITPPLPTTFDSGVFDFEFDIGDHLLGTYAGSLDLTTTPGLFSNLGNYLVTGGSGRFLGASGSIAAQGTVRFANGNAFASETLDGRLNLPAVPEPETWTLFIAGLGALMLRRRRSASQVSTDRPGGS